MKLCLTLFAALLLCGCDQKTDALSPHEVLKLQVQHEMRSEIEKAEAKNARLEWRLEQVERKLEGKELKPPATKPVQNAVEWLRGLDGVYRRYER